MLDDGALAPAVQEGLTSRAFVALVTWLTEQTGKMCKLEETVSTPQTDADVESFQIELGGFLKELGSHAHYVAITVCWLLQLVSMS